MRDEVCNKIVELIREVYPDVYFEGIDCEANLESIGINSVQFIQLIVMIENYYDIVFEDEMLNINKLDTISKFAEYIVKSTEVKC